MLTDPIADDSGRDIRSTVRRFLNEHASSAQTRHAASMPDGIDPALSKRMTDLGWLAIGVPEELGGADFGLRNQAIVFEEIGRALVAAPLLASAALALPMLVAGGDTELAPRIVDGSSLGALVSGQGGPWAGVSSLRATADGPGYVLDGTARLAVDGHRADVLVILASLAGRPAVFAAESIASGLTIDEVPTVDATRTLARVSFGACPARLITDDQARIAAGLDASTALMSAEMIGGAERALELTIDYLLTRHQFGRPIGSLQALKHRTADLAVSVSLARELVYHGADLLDAGITDGRGAVLTATLVRAAEVFEHVTGEAIQLHGGIGFTEEHDIGLYYRRALVMRGLVESPVDGRARLEGLLEI
jgi:alkylation response protein AidB-like acyl-CoA dehydrogenase